MDSQSGPKSFTLDLSNLPFSSHELETQRDLLSARYSHVVDLCITGQEVTGRGLSPKKWELGAFSLFTNVTSLRIYRWDIRNFQGDDIRSSFSRLGSTVTELELIKCPWDSDDVITLTTFFPLVTNLRVNFGLPSYDSRLIKNDDDKPMKGLQSLSFALMEKQDYQFLTFVNKNSPDLKSLSVYLCHYAWELEKLFNEAVELTSVSVALLLNENMSISLRACTKLETLSIYLQDYFRYDDPSWQFLETVTSTMLKEIRFYFNPDIRLSGNQEQWKKVDESLREILDRNITLHISFYPIDFLSQKHHKILWWYLQDNLQMSCSKGIISLSLDPEYPDELKIIKGAIN